MPTSVAKIIRQLNEAEDGVYAHSKVTKLLKLAADGNAESFQGLLAYMQFGTIPFASTYICARLAQNAQPTGNEYLVEIFRGGLKDQAIRYWAILGLIRTAGCDAYEDLAEVARSAQFSLDERAHALQMLARTSLQPFNRGLNRDPGHWKENDLRLDELNDWQRAGFPKGIGMPKPTRDQALDNPQSNFEKVLADFDSRLALYRSQDPDEQTNPSNFLASSSMQQIDQIKQNWQLPANYLTFIERFSPTNMTCQLQLKFVTRGINLYPASKLLSRQEMFAIDPLSKLLNPGWSESYVVIGDAWLDPFVIDLSDCGELDGPIYTAQHGVGEWKFRKFAKSFEQLLSRITVS